MRLQWALLLGAFLGAQAQGVVKRQDNSSEAPSEDTTTSAAAESSSSSAEEASSTSEPETSSGGGDDSDTTVFRTVTVTNNDVETVSSVTTVFVTSTRTVTVTETEIDTSTVTEDGETSTDTIFETSTQWVNKRDLSPRTLVAEDELVAAAAPYTTIPEAWAEARPAQDAHGLAKRATITRATTITVDGDGDATTVLSTARGTVITTVESKVTTTSVVTKTAQANARTTVTVTSTLTVTSTSLNSGVVTTAPPPGETGGSDSGQDGDNSNSSSDDGGLSTGAKAGIGAGVGVAGLLVIGGLIWFCLKRRRSTKADHDDLIGASEVPVGGPVGSGHTPSTTAHHSAAAAFLAPSRTPTKPSHSPEGYRGTAMGDGRAGFAKPAPYGSAYAGAVSPTTAYSQPTDYSHQPTDRSSTLVSNSPDGLPEHPTPQSAAAELTQDGTAARWHEPGAAEIDSRPAPMSHQSGPVYEMPSQSYR